MITSNWWSIVIIEKNSFYTFIPNNPESMNFFIVQLLKLSNNSRAVKIRELIEIRMICNGQDIINIPFEECRRVYMFIHGFKRDYFKIYLKDFIFNKGDNVWFNISNNSDNDIYIKISGLKIEN